MAEYTREDYYEDDWKRRAACRDDSRFIVQPNFRTAIELKAICNRCPVFGQCQQWADEDDATEVFAAGEWKEADEDDCLFASEN